MIEITLAYFRTINKFFSNSSIPNIAMKQSLLTLSLLLFFALTITAQSFPSKPSSIATVNDYYGMFTDSEISKLTKLCEKIESKQKIQTIIIVIENLDGLTPVEYAYGLGASWGLVKSKKILIVLLKPKTLNTKGDVFIATSYGGLNTIISDSEVNAIVVETVIPNFKKAKMYKGTKKGIDRVAKTIQKNESL